MITRQRAEETAGAHGAARPCGPAGPGGERLLGGQAPVHDDPSTPLDPRGGKRKQYSSTGERLWGETTGSKIMFSLSRLYMRSGFLRFLIFETRVDQTNRSTLVKLILFEKSRVELEFVFSIFTTRVRKHLGNSTSFLPSQTENGPNSFRQQTEQKRTKQCEGARFFVWGKALWYSLLCTCCTNSRSRFGKNRSTLGLHRKTNLILGVFSSTAI